ncbi:type I polyketide synthase, partial [Streptomyces sp. NPDC053367]|uniref:type I polyketide synthase n=1 Tax=Streptomyces sp. NPDC053367 TaxID=3365700 RepID=UPI0037D95175
MQRNTAEETAPRPAETAEPIAVTGLSCRLPGAPDPTAFWTLLATGTDALREMPESRRALFAREFPEYTVTNSRAGYLDAVDEFDAEFFGISPREARDMDPQQRLMLELAWEALEDAGVVPAALRETRTGVFVGAMADDYFALRLRRGPGALTRHSLTGTGRALLANRVSYVLGLRGPSLTVDTGQSSALAAVHLACQSLLRGECEQALVGGVNLILSPEGTARAAAFGGLSPDGRCHTFDSRAAGYARGEGGGAVLLKPLASALTDGDRVLGVILGSALTNDGATEGLTVPGAAGQEEAVRTACRRAGADPAEVQYVELHGTGTRVGDPVEARALGAALGAVRPSDSPLLVGSAKTNVGHLEGAAGIVGLLKTLLALRHRMLPPSLNFTAPHPGIPLGQLNLRVVRELTPWPAPDRPLLAGVSSFGMGGTNCHVLLGEAPRTASTPAPVPDAVPNGRGDAIAWVVSGRTDAALREQARRLREFAEGEPAPDPAAVGRALATTRTAFAHRAVVVGTDRPRLLAGLEAVAAGRPAAHCTTGTAGTGGVAFLFSGQGSQYAGMGRELYACGGRFTDAFDELCGLLDPLLGRPLRDVVFAEPGSGTAALLERTEWAQPALFALEVALFRQLTHWGLAPDAVAGHSIGELAAAHAAGVLSARDACALAVERGRLMQALPEGGAMAAVEATRSEAEGRLDGRTASVAAVNGPRATVISGDEDAVLRELEFWRGQGRRVRRLPVGHAFHSPRIDPMLDAFGAFAAGLSYAPAALPVVSNLTGGFATEEIGTAGYWVRHARQPVRFHDGIRTLADSGVTTYIELGPDAVLTAMARECLAADGPAGTFLAGLRRGRPEAGTLLQAVGAAHVRGAAVDWERVYAGAGVAALPTYAFQRRRHWLPDTGASAEAAGPGDAGLRDGAADREDQAADREDQAADREHHDPRLSGAAAEPEGVVTGRGHSAAEPRDDAAESAGGAALAGAGRSPEAAVGSGSAAARRTGGVVRGVAAEVLGMAGADEVDGTRTFKELGFDSLAAVEFRDLLAQATGRELPASLVFDHPTPDAVSRFLDEGAAVPAGTAVLRAEPVDPHEPVAVIGIGCRFPGGVTSPEELWQLLIEERDAITPFPTDRGWDLTHLTTATTHGGFLHDAPHFDAAFFHISPREAAAMDPQQRLLLETTWEAIERAGVNPHTLNGTDTHIYTGTFHNGYATPLHHAPTT